MATLGRTLACLLLLGSFATIARAQPWVAPLRYELEAQLDPAKKQVHGRARIELTNHSAAPLSELVFHLYLNAFRDEGSVFMRTSGGQLRGSSFEGSGSIELATLTVAGRDVRSLSATELVPNDRTQLRVPLATPLPPGEKLVVETRFDAQLPPLFARSGYVDDFFAVAQWFPKLAKLEPDGSFASAPYQALTEFYADYADYALTVRAPSNLQVVAGGALVEQTTVGATRVWKFAAERVHDIAFFAAPGYRVDVESVDGVLVRYFAPPGYERATREHAQVVRAGLGHFARMCGSYPYPELNVVVPPRAAGGAAGMEYPTLIVTGGAWLPTPGLPSLSGAFVTAHELAHQWFYGLLASDEVHFPVLDEGLSQWAALDLMRTLYGAREGVGALSFDRFEVERLVSTRLHKSAAPGQPAYDFAVNEYSPSVYGRAALALESIRRAHGRPRFERALALYCERQRFAHPGPRELERAFDDSYGTGFAEHTLRPLLMAGESSAVHLVEARTRDEGSGYLTHVRARRSGQVALPTWVALYDRDGGVLERVRFPAERAQLELDVSTHAPVARIVIDPDRALLLDSDLSDQTAHFELSSSAIQVARALGLAQLIAGLVGP
jgi:hypothetical protein